VLEDLAAERGFGAPARNARRAGSRAGVVRVPIPQAGRVVGAGVYDEEITLDELEAVSGQQ
jgi:hypothetical protein